MKTSLLWALALVALALWIFGLVSPQMLFGFAQIVLAGVTVLFLMHVVRRRRQKRDAARGPGHAP
jgi:predicted membrane-bound spermidine synthase